MSRLRAAFDKAAAEKRAALVAYLTFGDPDPRTSVDVVEAVCRAGADVIELGVPFSDPSADGPSIQRAMERALAAGGSLPGAIDAVAELRQAVQISPNDPAPHAALAKALEAAGRHAEAMEEMKRAAAAR